jgi:uncharacterized membrane protein YgcG
MAIDSAVEVDAHLDEAHLERPVADERPGGVRQVDDTLVSRAPMALAPVDDRKTSTPVRADRGEATDLAGVPAAERAGQGNGGLAHPPGRARIVAGDAGDIGRAGQHATPRRRPATFERQVLDARLRTEQQWCWFRRRSADRHGGHAGGRHDRHDRGDEQGQDGPGSNLHVWISGRGIAHRPYDWGRGGGVRDVRPRVGTAPRVAIGFEASRVPTSMLHLMHRWARALPGALALLALTPFVALAAGPPFPDPVDDRAVYDEAGMLGAAEIAEIEGLIDEMEAEVGAEMVVYTQHAPDISEDENLESARALVDQWGIGRSGFDDGVVLMVALDPDPGESRVSLFGGSGFVNSYASESDLQAIVRDTFVPLAQAGDRERAIVETVRDVTERADPEAQAELERSRQINAVIGIIGAPLALIGTLGWAWWRWRREGDDPDLVDSPSILMAGPPAEMTPALATVVRQGRADQHTINTTLVELAGSGRISFENLDRVREVKSDDDPDPLTDPAIVVHPDGDRPPLGEPQEQAWARVQRLAGSDGRLTRSSLWNVNGSLGSVKKELEQQAVRIGWLERMPGPSIGRMVGIGVGVAVIGGGIIWAGIAIPMSGAVLVGAALVLGGLGIIGFGTAMSQRTAAGAYVDAMLTAYRRTLRKTMDQARDMGEVVRDPEVATLADTPDKAVVWGLALGLRDEVSALLARGLAEQRDATGSTAGAYYPVWLGASSGGGGWSAASVAGGGVVMGSGSGFSDSAVPDIGGMFSALGSVGSSPPSSSSSSGGGGGFGGGGGGGGGGGSGSF